MNKPLVSVVMPVYNYARYLPHAIESILNQTYSNFEFIIIDDASTDNSGDIIRDYQKRYPNRIKLITLKTKLNCAGELSANEGIKIARGAYIARMDADDIALPTRLEKQVKFLELHPDIFLVGSSAYVIDENEKIIGEKIQPLTNEDIYKKYLTFDPIINPSSMYRHKLKDNKKFQYNVKVKYNGNNDYYTFFRLICKGYKFANLSEKLLCYRIHNKNATLNKVKKVFFIILRIRLKMLLSLGYKPTLKGIFSNILQIILVLLLSEKAILKLYLISKIMIKREKVLQPPLAPLHYLTYPN